MQHNSGDKRIPTRKPFVPTRNPHVVRCIRIPPLSAAPCAQREVISVGKRCIRAQLNKHPHQEITFDEASVLGRQLSCRTPYTAQIVPVKHQLSVTHPQYADNLAQSSKRTRGVYNSSVPEVICENRQNKQTDKQTQTDTIKHPPDPPPMRRR